MTINDIKDIIKSTEGISALTLDMSRQMAKDATDATKEVPTEWFSYWNENPRFRLVMHEDVFIPLKADKSLQGLVLKYYDKKVFDNVTPEGKAPYHRYVVTMPTSIEASF